MSLYRYTKEVKTNYFNEFSKLVRAKHKNKCAVCGLPHNKLVQRLSNGTYVVLDSFEAAFLKKSGVRVFKLFLHVVPIDRSKNGFDLDNYTLLCPYHSRLLQIENLLKEKKNSNDVFLDVTTRNILEIKNWIHNVTGVRPCTKDVVFLFRYVDKLINKQIEL